MSNSSKLCPTHFSKEAKKVLVGHLPPSYGPAPKPKLQKVITKFYEVAGHAWVDRKLVTNRLR